MAVFGQGAPGVRIQLRDLSQIDLVTQPIVTGGVVGFSSRGELNKIIDITSTADMDVILGQGFNNPQYNQGLYAARAVVQSGGFVEFVRPYGEEIIQDDNDSEYPFNQKLKTDTYLVEYNFTTPDDLNLPDSFSMNYMAATRYIEDSLSGLGEREIYTISETIQKNTNINFFLDADDTLVDDEDTVSLFAIMNSDPTAARRAGDKFDIVSISVSAGTVTVTTRNNHGLTEGQEIYITGTIGFNGTFTVLAGPTAKRFTYTDSLNTSLPESDGAVYINEDTIQSGVDYLDVKTAARGKSSKKLDTLTLTGIPLALVTPTSSATADSGSDTVVTVTLVGHGLTTGDTISVEGASASSIDGIYEITVNSTSEFEFTVTNVNLGVTTPDLFFAKLGNELFTVLTSDGTELLNEYVVEGQEPLSTAGALESGPIGISVIKSEATSKYYADTFDSAAVSAEALITLDTAFTTEFAVGDTVDISNSDITEIPDGVYTVSFVDESNEQIKLSGITSATAGTNSIVIDNVSMSVASGSKFLVGDTVRFDANAPTGFALATDYVIASVSGNNITLNNTSGTTVYPTATFTDYSVLVNFSATNRSLITKWVAAGYSNTIIRSTFDGTDAAAVGGGVITVDDASKFDIGDQVIFSDNFDENGTSDLPTLIDDTEIYIVESVDLLNSTVTFSGLEITAVSSGSDNTFQITNLTQTKSGVVYTDPGLNFGRQLNFIGMLGLKVPEAIQDDSSFTFFTLIEDGAVTPLTGVLTLGTAVTLSETTNDIMLDSSVGRTFLSLGLANEDYIDIDFDGDDERVFRLTSDGLQAARFFLFCDYFFAGETYSFAGTILPLVVNDTNLYIGDSAASVANGWTFQINQNASLQAAAEDSGFDLSQSIKDGIITSNFAQIAFNAEDPAIVNDAVWQYNPIDNRSSSALAESWNLFLDRDSANADMLISAGTAIQNLFVRGFEQIDYNVMDSMLNVCEKRKDMFSIFDGVDAPDIDTALRKMVGIGSQGELSRWGGIFDGRDIFFDADYTKLNVQAVKSIALAAIITLNRAGNVYWFPPAGYNTGRIPAQYSLRQKFLRSYNYAADPVSDIARLYDANINPTRVNDQGQFIYGQKTMLKRGSALNRMNVIMLVAGIHKRFENYLDFKVFQLNTAALRNNIQSDLQAQLDLIQSANPQGITAGRVVCDNTNNTPDIIDTNQLIVDVIIQPTRAAEFITLRTTVQRTGADLDITNTILGG